MLFTMVLLTLHRSPFDTLETAMPRPAFISLAMAAAITLACAKAEQQPAADSAMAPATTPGMISLTDVAGTWTMTNWNEARDSVLLNYELVATADTTGWMLHLPNRDPIPLRVVAVAGDSIVTETGSFESVLRKGVQVWSRSVFRLQDGKLVGTIVSHYSTKGADSVRTFPAEGTKKA
jgi:hypothetical protein